MCQCMLCDCCWWNCFGVCCAGLSQNWICIGYWCCKPQELAALDPDCCKCFSCAGWGGNCFCYGEICCVPEAVKSYSKIKNGQMLGGGNVVVVVNNDPYGNQQNLIPGNNTNRYWPMNDNLFKQIGPISDINTSLFVCVVNNIYYPYYPTHAQSSYKIIVLLWFVSCIICCLCFGMEPTEEHFSSLYFLVDRPWVPTWCLTYWLHFLCLWCPSQGRRSKKIRMPDRHIFVDYLSYTAWVQQCYHELLRSSRSEAYISSILSWLALR